MARNNPARKIFEFILAGAGLVRKKSKFSLPGPVLSCQNVQIPHQNEPIPCHGEKKVKIFLAGAGLARKKSKFSLPGQGWREKIRIFDPGNSCPAPPLIAMHRKTRSR